MKTSKTLTSLLIMLALLLVLPQLVLAESDDNKDNKLPKVPWQNYHGAMATGKAESKPILLHFTADWCKWCKKMKNETYSDFKVARYLQDNFSTGWVDTEQYRNLAKKYSVNSLPTLWFLDSDGVSLTRVDGYLGAEKMLLVLEFINTKAYKTMEYQAWKEKKLRR